MNGRARWGTQGIVAIALAALVTGVAAVLSAVSGADTPAPVGDTGDPAPAANADLPHGVKLTKELESLRTATSRTYETEDGQRLTKFFVEPVNYKDDHGDWQKIDTSLEPTAAGDTLKMRESDVDLSVPSQLDQGSVRLADDGKVAAFALEGANPAAAKVDGSVAHFDNAQDGVDADYEAESDQVKETLTLADRSASSKYRFKLRLSDDLRPKEEKDGSIAFIDAAGKEQMGMPAPTVSDARGATTDKIAYKIEKSGEGYELTVSVDPDWLSDADRAYPVKIDPTLHTYVAPLRDCTITSSTPTTSDCSSTTMKTGTFGTSESRALLAFDTSVIPKGAQIEESWLNADVLGKTGTAARDFGVYALTKPFSTATTWNQASTGTPWTTAGGDIAASASATEPARTTTPYQDYWQSLDKLVQGWVDGTTPNDGLLVKGEGTAATGLTLGASESTTSTEHPELAVFWGERPGTLPQYSTSSQQLFDRSGASVNLANGNLTVQASDLHMVGTGLDLNVGHVFNSRAYGYDGRMGQGDWRLTAGGGVALRPMEDGNLMYVGPSGSRQIFDRQHDGSFTSPTGIDAKVTPSGTHYKLTFDQSAEVYEFDASGDLVSDTDRNGNKITYAYGTDATFTTIGKLSSITDTRGQTTNVTYDGSGRVQKLTDPTARTYQYGYNGSGQLSSYTDPAGKSTGYSYDGSGNLSQITDPRGIVTRMEYDTSGRVTELKRDYNTSTGAYTARWRYAYSAADATCPSTDFEKTVVTDPRGNSTTYCFDNELRAEKVTDAKGRLHSAVYNADSQATQTQNPGASTTANYDSTTHDLQGGTSPAGETYSLGYGGMNGSPHQPTDIYNTQNSHFQYAYSTAGNLTGVTNGSSPSQIQATLEYNGTPSTANCTNDPATKPGTLRCAIDGNGNKTTYGYDALGKLTTITPPSAIGPTVLTYDSAGRLKTLKDGKGQTTTYSYDALDRKTGVAYADGSTITYGYDDDGNRTSRTDSVNGNSSWGYDNLNRPTSSTLPGSLTIGYGWDGDSNLTSLTDRSGTTGYGYDETNDLTSLTEPEGGSTTFGYDARDNRTSTSLPNGVLETRSYDASDKPLTIKAQKGTATPLTDFTYTYDLGARHTELVQTMKDKTGATTAYTYDGLDRLHLANTAGSDQRTYEYDPASNRIKQTINTSVTRYGFNANNQMCWSVAGDSSGTPPPCAAAPAGSTTYSYDADGNRTASSAGQAFTYNARNQTTTLKPEGGSAATNTYQGEGQSELSGFGGRTVQNGLLGPDAVDNDTWGRYDIHRLPDGSLFSTTQSGVHNYLLQDDLGSVASVASMSGTSNGDWAYDPWGNQTVTGQATQNFFAYAGGMRTNGFSHFGQRFYNSGTAQWTQADLVDQPISLTEGNRYQYAADDPTSQADPSGLTAPGPSSCKGKYRCRPYHNTDNEFKRFGKGINNGLKQSVDDVTNCIDGAVAGGAATLPAGAPEVGATAGCLGNKYTEGEGARAVDAGTPPEEK